MERGLAENENTLGEPALVYARRGWPVFPITPQEKRPLTRLAPHGFKNATTGEDQVSRWWDEEPEANIGLATGVAFDVLDIDSGFDGFAALDAAKPPGAPDFDGPTCTTGKGHHVYLAVTGVGNKASFIPGIDWRGRGGYVIAPPSIHPSGRRYEWILPGEPEREIGAVPAWLRELLEPARPGQSPWPANHGFNHADHAAGAYGRRALESEVAKVALAVEGTRNATVNEAAFALGRLVSGGELDGGRAFDALLTAGTRSGLSEQECVNTIKSGMAAGARQPRTAARRAG
jgi:hypothetical protein